MGINWSGKINKRIWNGRKQQARMMEINIVNLISNANII